MDFISEYKSKLGTPEDAAKLVKSGDWVEYGNGTTFAVECDKALAKRRDELFDVKFRGQIMYGPHRGRRVRPQRRALLLQRLALLRLRAQAARQGSGLLLPHDLPQPGLVS